MGIKLISYPVEIGINVAPIYFMDSPSSFNKIKNIIDQATERDHVRTSCKKGTRKRYVTSRERKEA